MRNASPGSSPCPDNENHKRLGCERLDEPAGLILMRLNDREEGEEYTPSDRGSSLANYIVAMGVLLGITVLLVRACQGSF